MPFEGDPIFLDLQHPEGRSDRYVRAHVKDASGAPLAGSPVALSHTGNGLYRNTSLLMPNTPEVTATFIVYQDAGYTIEAEEVYRSADVFTLLTTVDILSQLTILIAQAQHLVESFVAAAACALQADLEDGGIAAEVSGGALDAEAQAEGSVVADASAKNTESSVAAATIDSAVSDSPDTVVELEC